MLKATRLVSLCIALLLAVASYSFAQAPQWGGGFPKLAQKKALLQWDAVKGAAEYKVYRSEQKDKGHKLLATVKTNRYIDEAPPAGKTLYYTVSAVVGGKESARSAAGQVVVPKEKVFVPVSVPKLVGSNIKELAGGAVSVRIRWEGAAGTELIGVNVYRTKAKGKDYTMVGSSSADYFEDTDVKRGEKYYYAVTSVDSNFNETKRSNELDVDIPAPAKAEEKGPEQAPATEMRKAKLLFQITEYKEPAGKDASGKDKFNTLRVESISDVAVDEAVGHIYLSSYIYKGVLVYDLDGNFQYAMRKDGIWGTEKHDSPVGLSLGPNGDLYVADYNDNEVSVFTYDGKPKKPIAVDITHIEEYKTQKARMYDIAVAPDGTVFAGDPVVNRVHAYSERGKRLFDILPDKDKNKPKHKISSFNGISFMLYDPKRERVMFVDTGGVRVMEFSSDGKFVRNFGEMGGDAGQLQQPTGLALDNEGNVLVASGLSANVQAFDPETGAFRYALCNEKCDGPLEIGMVRGIYIDGRDRLYVSESVLNRVSVYQLDSGLVKITPPK